MKIIFLHKTRNYVIAVLTAMTAILLTMFSGHELSGENWGYWYFARELAETGKFVVTDRSPLYTLYLNAFMWIGYPHSVEWEYFITLSLTICTFVVFFRSYLGIWLALFATCLWLPFMQHAVPLLQHLALASCLVGVLLRRNNPNRFWLSSSYAFLFLAYYFRQVYVFIIPIFLFYDIMLKMRLNDTRKYLSWRPNLKTDWPIILVVIMFVWFACFQSPSLWNNVFFTNTDWFPGSAKSSLNGAGLHAINWQYIQHEYHSFVGHDFYFTNLEVFGGAKTFLDAVMFNPEVILEISIRNFKNLIPVATSLIYVPPGMRGIGIYVFSFAIIYGAFRGASDWAARLFVLSSLLTVVATIISIPKARYMLCLIPVFILAAHWYGSVLSAWLKRICPSLESLIPVIGFLTFICGLLIFFLLDFVESPLLSNVLKAFVVMSVLYSAIIYFADKFSAEHIKKGIYGFSLKLPTILLLIMLSYPVSQKWVGITQSIGNDIARGHSPKIFTAKNFSMKNSFGDFANLTRNCKGIISAEATFWGAFLPIPQKNIYAIWEIPPFGDLNNSPYKGLTPDRIDCVDVSHTLTTYIGKGSNLQLRYQNYIKPYVRKLQSLGASTYEVPHGQIVILQ